MIATTNGRSQVPRSQPPEEIVGEIDAVTSAVDRSRNYVGLQALEPHLASNAWRIERIKAGTDAAREGRVRPADEVFSGIAARHGWTP
jgi:predicted transcriptional regulator